jgi:prolactin regulatory element-binding protein
LKWKVDLSGEQNSAWSISVEGSRKAGEGGLTCFDVRFVIIHLETRLWSRPSLTFSFFFSPNGKFLAFGSSDYSLGILDSTTLSVSH